MRTASRCPFPTCDAAVLIAREARGLRRETLQGERDRASESWREGRGPCAPLKKQAARSQRSQKKRAERAGPRSREHSGRLPERPRRRPRRAPKSGPLRRPSPIAMGRFCGTAPVLQPPLKLPPAASLADAATPARGRRLPMRASVSSPEEHATEAPPGWDSDPWVRELPLATSLPELRCRCSQCPRSAPRALMLLDAQQRATYMNRRLQRATFQRERESDSWREGRGPCAPLKKHATRSQRSQKKRAERAGPRSRVLSGRLPERPRRRPRRAPKSGPLRRPSPNAMAQFPNAGPVLQPPLKLPPSSFAG